MSTVKLSSLKEKRDRYSAYIAKPNVISFEDGSH